MKPHEISALILTRDEERNLPRALASLPAGMQVLVLDAHSCDRTREFAESLGARVIQREWNGFVDARRFALSQMQTPWVFAIDADEALDDVLRDAILAADGSGNGYVVHRDTYFCGKPMRLWRSEKLVRLFRTQSVRVEGHPTTGGSAELHERYVVDGTIGNLAGTLLHFSYSDVPSYRVKYERYTAIEAQGRQRQSFMVAFLQFVGLAIVGFARFFWLLLVRASILDGWRGVYIAFWSAMYPAVVAKKQLT